MKKKRDYTNYDDDELLSLIQENDFTAFKQLYDRHAPFMYSQAYRALKDRSDAMDILQNIFSDMWLRRNALNDALNVSAYLGKATRNQVLNLLAKNRIQSFHLEKFHEENTNTYTRGTTDFLIREKELSQIIEEEIERLPAKMRQVFLLSRKHYLTHSEIAQELNLSEETVKAQIKNALRILRHRLDYTYAFIAIPLFF